MFKREYLSVSADACIILLFAAIAVRFLFGGAFSVLMPFIIAYLIAASLRVPSSFISRKTRLPIGFVSAVLIVLLITALFALIFFIAELLLERLGALLAEISKGESSGGGISGVLEKISSITSFVSAFGDLRKDERFILLCEKIDGAVYDFIKTVLKDLIDEIGSFLGRVVRSLPETLLYVIITIISSVYLSSRLDRVNSFLIRLIPEKHRDGFMKIKRRTVSALLSYLKAYSLIYVITFAELLFGFTLLGVKNGVLLAVFVAFVDILPVFGVGTVLIPWAVGSLLMGDKRTFILLLVLYAIITVIRELAEPKIVGRSIGLDPLLTLFIMFVGYKTIGVIGMIIAPLISVVAVGIGGFGGGEKREKAIDKNK